MKRFVQVTFVGERNANQHFVCIRIGIVVSLIAGAVTPLAVKEYVVETVERLFGIACWAVDDAVAMKNVVATNVPSIKWQKRGVKQIRIVAGSGHPVEWAKAPKNHQRQEEKHAGSDTT